MKKGNGFGVMNQIPRDIVAKRVVFDGGDDYKPDVKCSSQLYSTSPLPIKMMSEIPHKVRKDPNFRDFTGYRFGNFVVVGLFALDKFNKWVVRCCCGNYEIRSATLLNKNPSGVDQTRCQGCLDVERIRNRGFFEANGYYPWQEPKRRAGRRKRGGGKRR